MADISMCKDTTCPVRRFCYRYRAVPSDRQLYTTFDGQNIGCDDFVHLGKDTSIKLRATDVADNENGGVST